MPLPMSGMLMPCRPWSMRKGSAALRLARLVLRRRGLAADLVAGALGHVLPFAGVVVGRGHAGAAVHGGGAIVLAGLGHGVAFFLVALALCVHLTAGRGVGRAHARECGGNQCVTFVHDF